MSDRNARIVYSTGGGTTCPTCGWPEAQCKCSARRQHDEKVPAKVVKTPFFDPERKRKP